MKCPIETKDNAELLLSYSARRLDAHSAAVLEKHMELCPACREFRDGQQAVWLALDQWEAYPISPDFNRRLYGKIAEQDQLGWWSRTFALLLRPALPLAATACVLLIAGFITVKPGPVAGPAAIDIPQVREVEQVESALDDLDMLRQFDLVAAAGDHSRSI